MQSAVIYFIITWAETQMLLEKNKISYSYSLDTDDNNTREKSVS